MSPAEVQDFVAVLDGIAAHEAGKCVATGEDVEISLLEHWSLIQEAQPRTPVEGYVLRAMAMAAAQQRQLVALSGRTQDPDAQRRYAELGLRAGREVCRAAETWRKLRQPGAVIVATGG